MPRRTATIWKLDKTGQHVRADQAGSPLLLAVAQGLLVLCQFLFEKRAPGIVSLSHYLVSQLGHTLL
jgi:hypothetical protein